MASAFCLTSLSVVRTLATLHPTPEMPFALPIPMQIWSFLLSLRAHPYTLLTEFNMYLDTGFWCPFAVLTLWYPQKYSKHPQHKLPSL